MGIREYGVVWREMQEFTRRRTVHDPDQLWLLEHSPVFTLGQAGKREHLLSPGSIPIIKSDRGGQVTYHGPGQLVAYPLLDLRRRGLGIRQYIELLEESVIHCLAGYQITATRKPGAPGIYVDGSKIASLGLRVRKGYALHGLSLNVNMDLEPFSRINPCGYADLGITMISDLTEHQTMAVVKADWSKAFVKSLEMNLA